MSKQQQFIVTANHVAPEYRLQSAIVTVDYRDYRQYGGREEYSVTLPRFGSGKPYRNAADAIRGLLGDNGCTSITIAERLTGRWL